MTNEELGKTKKVMSELQELEKGRTRPVILQCKDCNYVYTFRSKNKQSVRAFIERWNFEDCLKTNEEHKMIIRKWF